MMNINQNEKQMKAKAEWRKQTETFDLEMEL